MDPAWSVSRAPVLLWGDLTSKECMPSLRVALDCFMRLHIARRAWHVLPGHALSICCMALCLLRFYCVFTRASSTAAGMRVLHLQPVFPVGQVLGC
jgi:hypothetical protein